MSRKGNCLDNTVMENFFGILKIEIFYGKKFNFKPKDNLKKVIEKYREYYNTKRIKIKLKGLTPAEYRSQFLLINN